MLWTAARGFSLRRPYTVDYILSLSELYVTMSEENRLLSSNFRYRDIVTRCSMLFTLHNGEIRIARAYTILE